MLQRLRPCTLIPRLKGPRWASVRPAARTRMAVQEAILPTEREAKLFKALLGSVEYAKLSTTLRCAGGWVRDKLLGLDSDDIDIAIDDMLGREFADHVNSYLESQNLDGSKIAVITSNPEQSKHLETAKMRLEGLELDLVNLRSETYTDSRIPDMAFGTAQQDAERRDFTVNSLFYNLNTAQVEDFTGSGIDDLRSGIIRTPLPARMTFLDDPLRVLRALRFAARFGFELEESLQEAAASQAVREALAKKVSRERMGVELEKIFTGPGPVRAMCDLQRLGLMPAVFEVPQSSAAEVGTSYGIAGVALMRAAQELLEDWKPQGEPLSKTERRLALMAALLLPLRTHTVPLKGARTQSLAAQLVSGSIKWRGSDAAAVEAAHGEASALLASFRKLQDGSDPTEALRVSLGRSLRSLRADKWRIGLLMAPLVAMREAAPVGNEAAAGSAALSAGAASPSAAMDSRASRVECCRQLEAAVAALDLRSCWEWKPLLDGKEIMRLLGVKGPAIGKLAAALVDFQLAHPAASQDDARDFLNSRHKEFL